MILFFLRLRIFFLQFKTRIQPSKNWRCQVKLQQLRRCKQKRIRITVRRYVGLKDCEFQFSYLTLSIFSFLFCYREWNLFEELCLIMHRKNWVSKWDGLRNKHFYPQIKGISYNFWDDLLNLTTKWAFLQFWPFLNGKMGLEIEIFRSSPIYFSS